MLIEINNIHKKLGGKNILNGINLQLEKQKIYNIIGHNGCGKTMLLRLLAGFIKPSEGELKKEENISTSVIIENPGFINQLSGYQNLEYLASINKIIGKEGIMTVLKDVGLEGHEHTKVKKYSLGMRQKLAIAQAIMENPDLILLDEPFNALDRTSLKDIIELLKKQREQGACIVIASHISIEENFYDKTLHMENGCIV